MALSWRRLAGHGSLAAALAALMAGPGAAPSGRAETGGPSPLFDGAAPAPGGPQLPVRAGEPAGSFALPFGARGVPDPHGKERPAGCGPFSSEARPGYLKGLAGGLWGLAAAPVAFAAETVQALGLAPVRMVAGVVQGDPASLLDPFRRIKGVAVDAVWTAVGMLSSASAPVWNVVRPDEATGFAYASDRLIFVGGPAAGVLEQLSFPTLLGTVRIAGIAPSWHTVALRRADAANPTLHGKNVYAHEFVHNRQHKESWWPWSEKTGHDAHNHGDYSEARSYLNW